MIDVLYLGCNMGNCGYRFFPRYPQAESDYYETFKWLVRLKNQKPARSIFIKHHSGDYRKERDGKELGITKGTGISYIESQLSSYEACKRARLVVCYYTTMILELKGMPHLAYFIRETRKRKRFLFKSGCPGYREQEYIKQQVRHEQAYFLDPGHRNRHFCKCTDELSVHDCGECKPPDIEVFEPLRICSYEQFKDKVEEVLGCR